MKYSEKLRAKKITADKLMQDLGIGERWAYYVLSGNRALSSKLIELMREKYKFLKPADFFK